MAKLTRKQALSLLYAAGAEGDRRTWTRIYVENRVSLAVANAQWRDGAKFGAWIKARDAAKTLSA